MEDTHACSPVLHIVIVAATALHHIQPLVPKPTAVDRCDGIEQRRFSSSILQTRYHDGPVFDYAAHTLVGAGSIHAAAVALDHEVGGKTQLATALLHVRRAELTSNDLRIVGDHGEISAARHQFPRFGFGRLAVDGVLENFHHVFFGVGGNGGSGALAVLWNVEGFVGGGRGEETENCG